MALFAGLPFANLKPEDFTVAMSGKVFLQMKEDPSKKEVLKELVKKTQVFARMTPDNKAGLVQLLQENSDRKVLMCGDGANDCAALKAADAGISLADSEASIAAPFSSKVQDVSCVPILLKEGRANLASTIQSFKFIMLYAIIQYTSAVVLYSIAENISDN
jgi:cation-transporting P-type ATPase 13A2